MTGILSPEMRRYLLDTNMTSYLSRQQHPHLQKRMNRESPEDFAISVITEAELLYGLHLHPEATRVRRLVRDFLGWIPSVPWVSETAQVYATLRSEMQSKGMELSPLDTMIAAHAVALDLTLITHDRAFGRLAGRLRVEDWVAEA